MLLSPTYLRLLANAMEDLGMCVSQMESEDFGDWLNYVKFALRGRKLNVYANLIREEFRMLERDGEV
jgi:hypothetical protein